MDEADERRAKAAGERVGHVVRMILSTASHVKIGTFKDGLAGGRMEATNVRADFPNGTVVTIPRMVIDRYHG